MKDIAALHLYTRVARLGSFSAAARERGMSQSQVSRIVAELEAYLGSRLLTRTTRAVVLTDAGVEFLARIEPILAALDEAEQSVREDGELRGTVRISMPTSVGVHGVIPLLPSFAIRHPGVHVHMLLDDSRQDLVREAVDVAIRLGRLVDSTATTKLMGRTPRVVVASPTYLERAGVPKRPIDLLDHRIVSGPASSVPTAWRFDGGNGVETIEVGAHFSSDENEGAVAAAIAGLGVTSTSYWSCRDAIANGTLTFLLTEYVTQDIPVHAYFPVGRNTRAAARALVDFLEAALRARDEADPILAAIGRAASFFQPETGV